MNLFNNDFLNTFTPLGQTSLENIEGKGPVSIILENLTVEARHGEDAIITIHYIDANGATQVLTPSNSLPAVSLENRDPQDPDGPVYICPVCGFTVIGEPPEKCPVSQTPRAQFVKF